MSTHTITIYSTNAVPLPLTISDDEGNSSNTSQGDANLTTVFRQGDTIRWEISNAAGCNIARIDAINVTNLTDANGNSYNLFTSGPQLATDGTTAWEGVIGMPGHTTTDHFESPAESYTITFTMTDNTQHTEDPRIKINQ